MAKTLHESFHEIVNIIRSLNIAAGEVSVEFVANGNISEQKLRRLLTINAKAVQVFASEKTKQGIGAYSQNELGVSFDVGATAVSTELAMQTFRGYMITNLPLPTNNGLDVEGNSSLLVITSVQMPSLLSEVNDLVTGTNWA